MVRAETIRNMLEEYQVPPGMICEVVSVLESLELMKDMTRFELFSGHGMTNSLYLFETHNGKYLLRVPGAGTAQIINRQHEKDVYRALRGHDISDKVLYINGETGIKICTYLEHTHTCDAHNPEEVRLLVGLVRQLHELNLSVSHEFDILQEMASYEKELTDLLNADSALVPQGDFGKYVTRYDDFAQTREQVMSLRPMIEKGSGKKCLCHIDAVQDNCLITDEGHTVRTGDVTSPIAAPKARLIDWEYAGMSDPYIDVAMFNLYAGVDKERADFAIACYLGQENTPAAGQLIYAYMAAGAYLWVIWSEIKRHCGVDFSEYEDRQYALAKEFYQYAVTSNDR